jgi:hypothetical protein
MNENRDIIRTAVESGIHQALSLFEDNKSGDLLGDLFLKVDRENGKLLVYDDLENLLSEKNLEISGDSEPESASGSFVRTLKHILNDLSRRAVFDRDFIFKPFSVNLVNEDFDQIEELLFLDGDMIKTDGSSLLDLDSELSGFLKDLLKI